MTLFGANLPDEVSAADFDLGPGVRVASVESASPAAVRLRVDVADDAPVGQRDVFLAGTHLADALAIFDQVHRITVTPEWGMARVGGANFPKQYQHFGVVAWHHGADEEFGTEDDIELGPVDATWSMEEYAATFGDNDIDYVGELREDGLFIPNIDGPNPERDQSRNNIGDVWVVASYTPPGSDRTLRARAHLLVTVPLYMRWDPWSPSTRPATEEDGGGGPR